MAGFPRRHMHPGDRDGLWLYSSKCVPCQFSRPPALEEGFRVARSPVLANRRMRCSWISSPKPALERRSWQRLGVPSPCLVAARIRRPHPSVPLPCANSSGPARKSDSSGRSSALPRCTGSPQVPARGRLPVRSPVESGRVCLKRVPRTGPEVFPDRVWAQRGQPVKQHQVEARAP
jgi:hypothetical protein